MSERETMNQGSRSLALVAALLLLGSEALAQRVDRYGDPLPDQAIARLGTVRFRGVHGCLAFSPDGKLLATATGVHGEAVTFWDTATGRAVRQVPGRVPLTHLAFSPDGKRLACSTRNRCRVLDVADGAELLLVAGFDGVFTADGRTLLTANRDATEPQVREWDATNGLPMPRWLVRGRMIRMTVAGDGRTLALIDAAESDVVRVCAAATGAPLCSIPKKTDAQYCLALAGNGTRLALAQQDGMTIWDTSTGEQLSGCELGAASALVFSPDGRQLAWTGFDVKAQVSWLWVMDCATGIPRTVGRPLGHGGSPCFSPDGKLLAAVTGGGVVRFIDVVTGKEVRPREAPELPVRDVAFTTGGRELVGVGGEGAFLWDVRTGRLLHRTSGEVHPEKDRRLLLPDGRRLIVDMTAPLFRLHDARDGHEVFRFAGRPDATYPNAVIAPGGRFAAVWWAGSDVCVLDLRDGKCLGRIAPKQHPIALALSADGMAVVCLHYNQRSLEFTIRHPATGKTITRRVLSEAELPTRRPDLTGSISPDCRRLVLPDGQGRLRQWDLAAGDELAPLTDAPESVWGFYWSPDSRLVGARGQSVERGMAFSEESGHIRWWDTATGNRLSYLDLMTSDFACLRFSPDGRTLATADLEDTIRLRETTTGRDRCVLHGHLPDTIGALAFRSDGRLLASGGDDTQAFVWDLTGHMPNGDWHQRPLDAAARQTAWNKLAGNDATAAYAALWQLVADPEGTLALMREQMKPLPSPGPKQVRAWIAALGSDDFAEREGASRALQELGDTVADELAAALKQDLPAEARRRLGALQEALQGPPAGRQLQRIRAVEVLEQLGTSEVRELLRKLAEGEAGRVAREARRALERP